MGTPRTSWNRGRTVACGVELNLERRPTLDVGEADCCDEAAELDAAAAGIDCLASAS